MIIKTASGGEECIRIFGEDNFDIVFLDYRMPGMDGIETLRRLREVYPEKAAGTPIIALTASAILGDKEKLIKEGFTDYLSKPVVIPEMEEIMSRYLGDLSKPDKGRVSEAAPSEAPVEPPIEAPIEIPQSILDISALDPERGLEYCGDAEDYLFALQTYAESVEDKASSLEDSLREDRIDDYTLLAHSLKSMSKSIGAMGLYEKAKLLEHFGHEGKKDELKADTEIFVKEYRELGARLREGLCDISL